MCTIKERNRIVLGFWKPLEIVLASANLAEKFAKILILAAVTTSLFRHADNGHILGAMMGFHAVPLTIQSYAQIIFSVSLTEVEEWVGQCTSCCPANSFRRLEQIDM